MKHSLRGSLSFWIALVMPWLLVVALPGTRKLLQESTGANLNWYAEDYGALSREFPNDLQIQIGTAKASRNAVLPSSAATKTARNGEDLERAQLATAMRRFPHAALPAADSLRFSPIWINDRPPGDLESQAPTPPKGVSPARVIPDARQNLSPHPESKEFTLSPLRMGPFQPVPFPSLSQPELRQALAAARQGQTLEPDNAYFDWVLVALYLKTYHDAAAAHALHKGSLKAYYDDHVLESSAASLAMVGKRHSLTLENRLSVLSAELFPHATRYRAPARLLSWQAWKLTLAGQHEAALTLRADLARMGHLIQNDRNSRLTQSVGGALQGIAWWHDLSTLRAPRAPHYTSSRTPDESQRRKAKSFATYAQEHGNNALATETGLFWHETQAWLQSSRQRQHPDWYGIPHPVMRQVRTTWWLSCGLLWLSALLALVCLPLALWLRRVERGDSPRDYPLSAWCFGLTVLAGAGALRWGLVSDEYLARNTSNLDGPPSAFEMPLSVLCRGAFFLIPVVLPLLFCFVPALWTLCKDAWAYRRHPQAARRAQEPSLISPGWKPFLLLFLKLLPFIFFLYAALAQFNLFALESLGLDAVQTASLMGTCGAYLLAIWTIVYCAFGLYRWRFRLSSDERPLMQSVARRYHALLCRALVAASWAYAATLYVSLPARQSASEVLDLALRQGITTSPTAPRLKANRYGNTL